MLVEGLSTNTPYYFTITSYNSGDTEIVTFSGDFTTTATATFIEVTNITGIPTVATAGTPLSLTATIEPSNATNQTIIWSVSPGNTLSGVSLNGNTFSAAIAGTAKVRVTITNGLTESSDYEQDFEITIGTTGIVETNNYPSVQIYPNPAKYELQIESGELRIIRMEILDLSGKIICQFNGYRNQIDVSALSQGIYFIKIETDNGVVTRKFVKKQ